MRQWLSSWRLALRVSGRDVRRHKGRSALVLVMIGLPVALLVGGQVLVATMQVSPVESIPYVMGAAQARVTVIGGTVTQSPDGSTLMSEGQGPMPTDRSGDAATVRAATHATSITPVQDDSFRVLIGQRRVTVQVLGADGRSPLTAGMVQLLSGRWPRAADEVLVTPQGQRLGIPTSGTITVSAQGSAGTYRVVGTAFGYQVRGGSLDDVALVTLPHPAQATGWLVGRDTPLTWSEVRQLNARGLEVLSRAVLHDPPPAEAIPAQVVSASSPSDQTTTLVVLIAATGLFIEAALLAGPAFAVSAARSRRMLALAAANGATRKQVRRLVLAQAVRLGALSALGGLVAGVALPAIGLRLLVHGNPLPGPWQVPVLPVILVAVTAIAAATVAALAPARGVMRLDLVAALRGDYAAQGRRAGLPILGALALVAGAGLTLAGITLFRHGTVSSALAAVPVAGGALALVLGGLLLLPAALRLAGRMTRWAPLPLRVATRDSTRQGARAVSAIAAIMAASGAMSALAMALSSDAVQGARDHVLVAPLGTGYLQPPATEFARTTTMVHRVAPDAVTTELSAVSSAVSAAADPTTGNIRAGTPTTLVAAVRPGCTAEQALQLAGQDPSGRCLSLSSAGTYLGTGVLVAPLDFLTRRLHLTSDQSAMLSNGAMLLSTDPAPGSGTARVQVSDGTITLVTAAGRYDANGTLERTGPIRTMRLPALVLPRSALAPAFVGGPYTSAEYSAAVTPQTAAKLGWPTSPQLITVAGPGGSALSAADERAIDQARDDDVQFVVEHGYQRSDQLAIAIALAVVGLLILVATLTATALGQAENAPFLGTLAAVGATRATRRMLAAAQAGAQAVIGAAFGSLLGLAPGAAMAVALTSRWDPSTDSRIPPVVVVPWPTILALVVLVPLLAGAIAWLGIRRSPAVTRRVA